MRYPPGHKDTARQRLVTESGSHAKRHGFGDSGMASLAQAAGVTTGALYKHFDGKAGLFAALIEAELARTAALYAGIESDADAHQALFGYLSMAHVRAPELGCPLPALAAEVARADVPVREAYQAGLADIHAQLARLTRDSGRAWALLAQSVGAVMLARALPDEALQRELLAGARAAGEVLLQPRSGS